MSEHYVSITLLLHLQVQLAAMHGLAQPLDIDLCPLLLSNGIQLQ